MDSYNGSSCRLINAGADGIYVCLANGKRLSLQKVDMTDGTLETAAEVPEGDMADASLELYSGYSHGLLISDSRTLWKYKPVERELVQVLEWRDSTVGLENHIINTVGILPDGSLYVAAHQPGQEMALIHIASGDISEVTQKKTAVLARMKQYEVVQEYLETMAVLYNRMSTEYQVELRSYDSLFDLETELLNGGGPDIFCFGEVGVDIYPLASKGVVEDLSPYFAGSSVVGEEDLLSAVRDAGMLNGQILCVIPSFSVKGILVAEGVTDSGRWTAEDYVALGEENPDIPLEFVSSPKYYLSSVLQSALKGDMEHYVDWEERKCRFDSEEFVSLLERISRLRLHGNTDKDYRYSTDADIERISTRAELTASWGISRNDTLLQYMEAIRSGAHIELAGYPCQGDEPYYELFSLNVLGINSASRNKEAAWSFLEFLLSEECQKELDNAVPARQDAFDWFLDREEDFYGRDISLSEEEKEYYREVVEHAHWMAASNTEDILGIVTGEASAVWAGDKTARQAAEIIQNRVTLFLNE